MTAPADPSLALLAALEMAAHAAALLSDVTRTATTRAGLVRAYVNATEADRPAMLARVAALLDVERQLHEDAAEAIGSARVLLSPHLPGARLAG